MSALLEVCLIEVLEQMTMRQDQIGQNHENLKALVVSCTANHVERDRKRRWCWRTVTA